MSAYRYPAADVTRIRTAVYALLFTSVEIRTDDIIRWLSNGFYSARGRSVDASPNAAIGRIVRQHAQCWGLTRDRREWLRDDAGWPTTAVVWRIDAVGRSAAGN